MKSKVFFSTLVLLLFALLGGGSLNETEATSFFSIILVVCFVALACYTVVESIISRNKDRRLKLIKDDEANSTDFDRSIFIGDDRCRIYFDSFKKQVLIMRIMTEGIKKEYIDDFEFPGKELACFLHSTFNIYDPIRRKLLSGTCNDKNIIYDVTNIGDKDKNNNATINNTIKPIFVTYCTKHTSANSSIINERHFNLLIDECHGLMAITRAGKAPNIFNYIDGHILSKKTGDTTTISIKTIGNHLFIVDNLFKVLVIITSSTYEVFKFSDIIEVSYEENGDQLYTKSVGRTIGGAVVGGVLMGGAGAVIGGLSGASKQNKEVKNMDIKILLRNTNRPSYVLHFKETNKILKTKEAQDKKLYEAYIKNANQAKEILSIIIDDVKQTITPTGNPNQPLGIAHELEKLVKLKADGILTEEEFQAQKAKLLGII